MAVFYGSLPSAKLSFCLKRSFCVTPNFPGLLECEHNLVQQCIALPRHFLQAPTPWTAERCRAVQRAMHAVTDVPQLQRHDLLSPEVFATAMFQLMCASFGSVQAELL